MITEMEAWIPWQVRERVRALCEYPIRRDVRARIQKIRRSEDLVVGFGGVLDDGRPVRGGAVKLLHLRDHLPASEEAFSILYAVSSSLPECARDLFQHCRRAGIRIVWNQNGVGYPAWAGRESERFNRPMRELRAMADFVIYQSRFCEESAEKFLGPCAAPSAILYNPVDLTAFASAAAPARPGPLRLLAAGTHGTRDRVASVVEALRILVSSEIDAVLTVAGSFRWRAGEEDIAHLVRSLGLEDRVLRVPSFEPSDAAKLYQAHDLLLHPKYMDPCPTVVLEALACGLPVVGSRSGGMPEMVPPEAGRLIEAPLSWDCLLTPSGADMAAAVKDLLPDLRPAAAAARRHVEAHFGAPAWVQAHRDIFHQVLRPA